MSLFRNLLIEKKRKPYYCEVEYLQSDGNQWIDTGVTINTSTDEVNFNFQLISTTLYYWLMGEHDNGARFGVGVGDGTNKRNIAYGASTYKVNDTQVYNNIHYLVANSNGVYLDNTQVHAYENFTSTSTIYLFNLNISGGGNKASGKIWKYTHKRGGVTIRDMIPVLDWNYTPCMYDKVSGRLFYNQGTGTFTYGREIHYVDYLESTGTQYIDTGVKLTNNYSVELDYQLTQASQSRAGLFGALNMTGSNQGRIGSILSPSNSQLEHGYGSGNDYWQQGMPDTNRHKLYQKKNETYFDGSLVHTFNTATFSLAINAYLGNFVYTKYTPAKAKYYSSKWWDGDILVRDYLPAIDENGVCFWFDRVAHTIFDNKGTGAFQYPVKQTEYLQSSGTQYIDTNYAFTDNFSWEITFEGISEGCTLFGGRTSSARTALLYQRNYGGIDKTTCPIAGYNGQETPFQLDDLRIGRHIIKMSVASNKGSVWVDNTQIYNKQAFTGTYISGTTQAIFADNFGTSVSEYTSSKVYALKMWQGTTIKRDYISAYKNGIAGLYDKANNIFYSNAGTGTFTAGKIVESRWF